MGHRRFGGMLTRYNALVRIPGGLMNAASIRMTIGAVLPIFAAAALVAGPVQAQDIAGLAARLQVLEDREEIRQLILSYGEAHDHRDYRSFASLFAREGEWIGGLGSAKGPEAIFALLDRTIGHNPLPDGSGTVHMMSNFQIEVEGDRATAVTKWLYLTPGDDDSPRTTYLGHYNDDFIRENGRWRFLRRQSVSDISPMLP